MTGISKLARRMYTDFHDKLSSGYSKPLEEIFRHCTAAILNNNLPVLSVYLNNAVELPSVLSGKNPNVCFAKRVFLRRRCCFVRANYPNVQLFQHNSLVSSFSLPNVSKIQIHLVGQVVKREPIALFGHLRELVSMRIFATEDSVEQACECDDDAITFHRFHFQPTFAVFCTHLILKDQGSIWGH